MRLCHRAGYAVPLLTISAILAGCATSTTDQPPNFNSSPQVVAVYAIDSAFGTMPDVLIYSTAAGDTGKISTNPPPSYGSYRVEFDQPINGTSVANNADRGTGPTPGGAASFCSPLSTNPFQLVDVDGGNRVVVSSVCYDATSPLGEHPHVLVVPGRNALNDPTAKPLTCNTFRADPGLRDDGNVFAPKHKYGIKVNAPTIQNAAGKALAAPTGGGWTGDTFQFTTSGFKILAAGFQDANTGFFVWLDKPEPGFEKDLAPCATTSTCPDANDNLVLNTFQEPADSNPFLVVFSEPVQPNFSIFGGDVSDKVALTRAEDGSNPDSATLTGFIGGLIGDPRVAEVFPGDTFEPGVSYKVTIDPALAADSGDVLENAKTYTFSALAGAPAKLSTGPANGAQAQAHTVASITVTVPHIADATPTPTTSDVVTVLSRIRPTIEFSSPVAPTTPGGTTPGGTFKLTGPAGDVAVTVTYLGGVNNQIVRLAPAASLLPETTYTVSWSGVKAAPVPKALAGQAFPDGSSQFTTATFRMAILDDPAFDTATSNTNIGNTGIAFPGITVVAVNLDRRVDVEPAHLKDGKNLHVIFNNNAAGVDGSSVQVSELTGTANTASPPIAGTVVAPQAAGDTKNFTITLPASYQLKYGQKYEIRTKTTITNPDTGKALKAEGAGGDDVKTFTTRKVSAAVAPNPSPRVSPATTGFTVKFSDPMDPTTIDLVNQFKLFARDTSGALNTTPVPITCKLTDGPGSTGTATNPTVVTCTPNAGLGLTPKSYLASAVFLQTAPVKVLPSVSSDPSAVFFGSVSANVFAPCQ